MLVSPLSRRASQAWSHPRPSRACDAEFSRLREVRVDAGGQKAALLAWIQVYENVRPHQGLGYRTPEEFYQQWLTAQDPRKEVELSGMT